MTSKPFEPDEKLLEVIRRGAISRVVLQPLSYADAVALRMKLYRLKDKLTKHQHPANAEGKLVTVKLKPQETPPGSFAVIVHPKDWGLELAFANAGITKPSDEPPSLD